MNQISAKRERERVLTASLIWRGRIQNCHPHSTKVSLALHIPIPKSYIHYIGILSSTAVVSARGSILALVTLTVHWPTTTESNNSIQPIIAQLGD